MKTSNIILITIASIMVFFGGVYIMTYNNLVSLEENVAKQESNIDTVLQRRADLIPNLVNTAKGYSQHEETVFKELAEARTNMNNASSMEDKANAENELSNALSKFNMVVEAYPELKSDKHFSELMTELEGTENRITVARKDYNSSVETYNRKIKGFFTRMFFGRSEKQYFKADGQSKANPVVDFNK